MFQLSATREGVTVSVYGYNERLHVLLVAIAEAIARAAVRDKLSWKLPNTKLFLFLILLK